MTLQCYKTETRGLRKYSYNIRGSQLLQIISPVTIIITCNGTLKYELIQSAIVATSIAYVLQLALIVVVTEIFIICCACSFHGNCTSYIIVNDK
jgi:hypothetical protein